MIGAMFKLGEQKVRPGVYVRWYNDGGTPQAGGSSGIAAAVIKSNWGPLQRVIAIDDANKVEEVLGTGKGAQVAEQILLGGATELIVVRAGLGGTASELSLKDSTGVDLLKIKTKYPTSREFNVTIRESLNVGEKEFIAYEGNHAIERFSFAQGSNEAETLASLINTTSIYFTAEALGNDTFAPIVNERLTGGADPDIVAKDYTDAFGILERKFFDGITVDTEDTAIHASLNAYINRSLQLGSRIIGVVGEKIDVPFNTRIQNARSFNNFSMVYVGNGYAVGDTGLDGALAAGRVLGEMVSGIYKASLTKKEIQGSTGVYGELTPSQYIEAAKNGMLVFSESVNGVAQIDYGINTLVSTGTDEDEGWKKIRRVRTRFELIDRIAFTIANAMSAGIDNNNDGRQHLITLANGIINNMIQEGGLESGEMIIDPSTPPQGDSVWYKFDNLVDLDGIEKVYLAFGFRY
ncbi:MAG TPA: phage tail sheath protein [Bacillus bacterium]|uniref:phage tail sheath subtilisin-like domain-containing protein n=1 Tax=Siminovitchia fordii TaxID=254759 RepID=UPI00036287EA|nr:phage tail sheath subtilisin-like domain-containing protein [Siminovitchia fordii]HBZ09118.1 phage tail sheath protein [Bacillus sp. (in: firmicutes)]